MTGQANINGQRGEPWRDKATIGVARARSRSRSPPLTPVMTSHRYKRPLTALESEELTDRAATEMEDHVEQDYSCATNLTRMAQHTEAWTGDPEPDNLAQNQTKSISTKTEITSQVSSDIPDWVLAESEAMSREVTPPTQCFFQDSGERQDGDCSPAVVIGALYYVYCQTGLKRTALESLMTYSAIRHFATDHLQQRTLLAAAQVDYTQMEGWQVELHRVTQDLWSQIPRCTSAWLWKYINQTESQSDNRQAVWWSDLVVALVIKAALAGLPTDPEIRTPALQAAQAMRAIAGE